METSVSEPLMKCRKELDDVETGIHKMIPGQGWTETCVRTNRHPAYRRRGVSS
jgi:hypothetical protein